MRPIIDENGVRLIDDQGNTVPGLRKLTVYFELNSVLSFEAEFLATDESGKPILGRHKTGGKA